MAESADEIAARIRRKRERLRENLAELEGKVRAVTDWRQQVRSNTGLMLGLAFGAGLVLSAALNTRGGRRASRLTDTSRPSGAGRGASPAARSHLRAVWDEVQAALLGIAAARVTEAVATAVPQVRERLRRRRARTGNGHVQGEGDYEAARRYAEDVSAYVRSADVERAAHEAAPKSVDEALEMAAAEQVGRRRAKPS